MWTQRAGEDGMNRERSVDVHTLPCVKETASGKLLYHRKLSSVLCDDLDGWDKGANRGIQEGEDICKCIAGSLHCTAETNTTL